MIELKKTKGLLLAGLFGALCAAPSADAWTRLQDEEGGGGTDGADEEESDEADGPENYWLAVIGGDVYTGTGEVLRGATVVAKNGKIREIGYDVELPGRDYFTDVPEDERTFHVDTIDATGLRVYPGLVSISSSGLMGTNGDFRDSIDPFGQNMVLGLASGITTSGVGNSAVKLKRYVSTDPPRDYDFDGIVLNEKTYASLSYSMNNPSSIRSLKEKLEEASTYLRKFRQWEEDVKKDKELKEPSKRGVDGTVLSVLKGEILARFRSNDRPELLGIARLAQQYGFRPVIEGCREGWTVADELGRAGVYAIVTPRDRRDKDESLVRAGGSSIENARILHEAGVQVAVVPAGEGISLGGIVGRDIMHLPVEVGFAIRGGLPEEAGFASITTVPARMMGINHRVGTLEVGKDADLIVTDGDILHYQTFVQYAVVDGQLVYDKQEELFFAHIRPRPESALAPATRIDAGENPVSTDEPAGDDDEDGDDGAGDSDDDGGEDD